MSVAYGSAKTLIRGTPGTALTQVNYNQYFVLYNRDRSNPTHTGALNAVYGHYCYTLTQVDYYYNSTLLKANPSLKPTKFSWKTDFWYVVVYPGCYYLFTQIE